MTIRLFQDARFRYKIKNAPRKFHLDNIQLKAHKTPVYRKGKPVPADAIDVSFETGQWNWNKARVETVENGEKRKLFIRKGANLNLKLPLAQLKGKSLAFRYRAAGSGKLNVRLDMGRAGGAVNTLHSPEKLSGHGDSVLHRSGGERSASDGKNDSAESSPDPSEPFQS